MLPAEVDVMDASERRENIIKLLGKAEQPVSASALAAKFDVSRQIIVGDIALLRAAGSDISATPRGYVISQQNGGVIRQIACRHSSEDMQKELYAVVDEGCTVIDVIVGHPVYGQLTGSLQLSSRFDVNQFILKCSQSSAHPLSLLTGGIHLHTISCPDEAAYQRVKHSLDSLGILLPDSR